MNRNYYLKKLRKHPPHITIYKILSKIAVKLKIEVESLKANIFSTYISDKQLSESLVDSIEDIDERLKHIRERKQPNFFLQPSDRSNMVDIVKSHYPNTLKKTMADADKICDHVFNLLGSGDVYLGEKIDWHTDFKTGYRWNPKEYYKEIEIPYGKADIKVPWELSRFQHAVTLGQVYWLTGDEKYAREFVTQVEDWIDGNPPKFGVNWACTMDVAIRVSNWIWGYYFFKDSPSVTDEFLLKFLKSVLIHGRHIMNNLENKGRVTSNHYLSDLVGLIYLGITFPEFKEATEWREFGIQEMIKEMDKQVYDDGMDFEASTCYHRLALELFFFPTLLCQLNDIELPNGFIKKLKRMFDFVLYTLKPNGKMPQIGDNDNGRLHVLGKRDILDMTYLLTFATLFFDDPKYKIEEFGFAPEALWLFGPESYERWQETPGRSVEELQSQSFPDGGIYVMRHKKDYMAISCGPNGQSGNGSHTHNDKLSFELCVNGEDLIADPGTYVYTTNPEWRNQFRSTAYHNTVVIDGKEQNQIVPYRLFHVFDGAKAKCVHWRSNSTEDLFLGQHFGYRRLPEPIIHRREIHFDKKNLTYTIRDIFSTEASDTRFEKGHRFTWFFHLPAHIKGNRQAENEVTLVGEEVSGKFVVKSTQQLGLKFIEDRWYSPQYGVKEKTSAFKIEYYGKRIPDVEFLIWVQC